MDLVNRLAADSPLARDDRNAALTSTDEANRAPGGFAGYLSALARNADRHDVAMEEAR